MWHLDELYLKPETSHLKPCLLRKFNEEKGTTVEVTLPS
jgi:hypothetical protein